MCLSGCRKLGKRNYRTSTCVFDEVVILVVNRSQHDVKDHSVEYSPRLAMIWRTLSCTDSVFLVSTDLCLRSFMYM